MSIDPSPPPPIYQPRGEREYLNGLLARPEQIPRFAENHGSADILLRSGVRTQSWVRANILGRHSFARRLEAFQVGDRVRNELPLGSARDIRFEVRPYNSTDPRLPCPLPDQALWSVVLRCGPAGFQLADAASCRRILPQAQVVDRRLKGVTFAEAPADSAVAAVLRVDYEGQGATAPSRNSSRTQS